MCVCIHNDDVVVVPSGGYPVVVPAGARVNAGTCKWARVLWHVIVTELLLLLEFSLKKQLNMPRISPMLLLLFNQQQMAHTRRL